MEYVASAWSYLAVITNNFKRKWIHLGPVNSAPIINTSIIKAPNLSVFRMIEFRQLPYLNCKVNLPAFLNLQPYKKIMYIDAYLYRIHNIGFFPILKLILLILYANNTKTHGLYGKLWNYKNFWLFMPTTQKQSGVSQIFKD